MALSFEWYIFNYICDNDMPTLFILCFINMLWYDGTPIIPIGKKRNDVDIIIGSKRCRFFLCSHDDVIKWKRFPRNWPFARGIHQSPVNSHQKGQWRRALILSLICPRINGWVKNHEAGDLRRHRTHHDATLMNDIIWLCVRWVFAPFLTC